jgi:hypothetical protein
MIHKRTMQWWMHKGMFVGRIAGVDETLCVADSLEQLEDKLRKSYVLVTEIANSPAQVAHIVLEIDVPEAK